MFLNIHCTNLTLKILFLATAYIHMFNIATEFVHLIAFNFLY